jgi:ABC-2 type transport system ATP-binding protein
MKTKIIEAQNLTKTYKNTVKAIEGISFSVDEGELFGFLDPTAQEKPPPPSNCQPPAHP